MRIDPQVCRRKFDAELAVLDKQREVLQSWGCWIVRRDFPAVNVVFVPRWPLKLAGNWASTTIDLPQGKWTNLLTREILTGGRSRVQTLFQRFPVALLTRESK